MTFRILSVFALVAGLGVAGCQRKTSGAADAPMGEGKEGVPESLNLHATVDAYARRQNPENDLAVRNAMASVDGEIAELQDLLARRYGRDREKIAARLRRLEVHRSEETTRFAAVQAGQALVAPIPGEDSAERPDTPAKQADVTIDR